MKQPAIVPPDRNTVDVLLVSGSRTYASAARLALDARGCRVTTAADGASALAMAERTRFHLLIVDERLPDIECARLLEQLGARAMDARIVMLLAETSATAVAAALRAGAHAVHPRPPTASGLTAIVGRERSGGAPLLDGDFVAELRATLASPGARGALLGRFEAESLSLWTAAHQALVAGRAQALAASLHRLRGATASIGALACERRLAALAIRVDAPLLDDAEWEACRALLEQSIAALRRALA